MAESTETRDETPQFTRKQLWSLRNPDHIPARLKRNFPVTPLSKELAKRALAAVWPWARCEYPGKGRLLAWAMGDVSVETANRFSGMLPRKRARIMADRLQVIADRLLAMVAELRAYAGERGPLQGGKSSVGKPVVKVPPPVE